MGYTMNSVKVASERQNAGEDFCNDKNWLLRISDQALLGGTSPQVIPLSSRVSV